MRVLILSDLHANLSATEAVLADAKRDGWEMALVLGDLVGYGADPAPVIDLVRTLPNATVIRGNHDKVVAGLEEPVDFNAIARHAVEWTSRELDEERTAYLKELPRGPLQIENVRVNLAICHGAPFDEDYYVFDGDDAAAALAATPADLLLCGHTHLQMAFELIDVGGAQDITRLEEQEIAVGEGTRILVNPGSVGQPRDGDARAAYATLDTDSGMLMLHRVDYDVAEAQRRILEAGLHPGLAQRLSVGR